MTKLFPHLLFLLYYLHPMHYQLSLPVFQNLQDFHLINIL